MDPFIKKLGEGVDRLFLLAIIGVGALLLAGAATITGIIYVAHYFISKVW